jgi:hypothetical protein
MTDIGGAGGGGGGTFLSASPLSLGGPGTSLPLDDGIGGG